MENKRGQLQLWGIIGLVLVASIFLAFFYFSTKFRFIVLGTGFLIGGFVMFYNKDLKQKTKTSLGIGLIAIGFILIFSSGVLNQAVQGFSSSGYFEAPYFATIRCEQKGVSDTLTGTIPSNGEWISDKLPTNTNEWSIKLLSDKRGTFSIDKRFEYYVCDVKDLGSSTCRRSTTEYKSVANTYFSENIGTISAKKYIWVQYQSKTLTGIKGEDGSSYEVTFKPFVLTLEDRLRVGLNEIGTNGCIIPTSDISWQNRILSSTDTDLEIATSSNSLKVGEWFNYVSGTVTRAEEGNLQGGGYCIYSNGNAKIYSLDTLKTAQATYKIVNTDDIIGNPECCNGLTYPDGKTCSNGNFINLNEKPCSTSSDCGSLEWNRYLGEEKTIAKWTCQKNIGDSTGTCVQQTQKVECSADTDCANGYRCSVNTWKCVSSATIGNTSGQLTCDKWYQEEGSETTYKYSVLGIKFGATEQKVCKTASWLTTLEIIGAITILGGLALYLNKPKRKKK